MISNFKFEIVFALLLLSGCNRMLAEQAVRAPNRQNFKIILPPTPPILTDSLKSAKELTIHVGPPDADLHVWISPPNRSNLTINAAVSAKETKIDMKRSPVTRPTTRPEPPPGATIILLHGIYDRQENGPYLLYKEVLTAAGYQVVQVDLRGHGRSTGEWITYGVVESKDLVQMLDALQEKKLVDGPVAVMGVSYGAAIAIQWAAIDPRIKSVVALEPFASFEDAAHDAAPLVLGWWKLFFSDNDIKRAVQIAGELAGFDPKQASALDAISKMETPVLLIHSRSDELISYRNSQRLKEAGASHCGLITVNDQSHFWMWLQSLNMIGPMSVSWFNAHMGGRPTTTTSPSNEHAIQ